MTKKPGRPPSAEPQISVTVRMPVDLRNRLLRSVGRTQEERLPYGLLSALIVNLLNGMLSTAQVANAKSENEGPGYD